MILSNSLSTYYQPKENKLNGYGSEWWYKTNIGTKRIPRMNFFGRQMSNETKKAYSIPFYCLVPSDSMGFLWKRVIS